MNKTWLYSVDNEDAELPTENAEDEPQVALAAGKTIDISSVGQSVSLTFGQLPVGRSVLHSVSCSFGSFGQGFAQS